MKIKVAVAKSVKALVDIWQRQPVVLHHIGGHINLKNLNLRKKRSNR